MATLLLVGCGADANSVSGTVTLDNEPLANAQVQFRPLGQGGRIATSRTAADGSYKLKSSRTVTDVAPGKYQVTITTRDAIGEDKRGNATYSKEKVPANYNEETELTKEVQAGRNEIDFDLTN